MYNAPLLHEFDSGIINIMESTYHALVYYIFYNKYWKFATSIHDWEIDEYLHIIFHINKQAVDSITWKVHLGI